MSYSSADEGEVMRYEGDKATKTRPPTRDSAIDRRSRPRSPLSRSPRPLQLQYDGAQDALDYGEDSRSGPHGQKRRHDHESHHSRNQRDDPRRFQVRYEPGRTSDDRDRRRDAYRSDRGPHNNSTHHARYDDRGPPGKRHQSEKQRQRSPSPSRYREPLQFSRASQASGDQSRRRRSSTDSVGAKESIPMPSDLPRTSAVPAATIQPTEEDVEPVVVDEAKLIEERRRRREALRAKHRGQNTPLLQKALETNAASLPQSPSTSSFSDAGTSGKPPSGPLNSAARTDSEAPSTPASLSTSQPGSPASPATFSVTNDEDLANPAQASPSSQHGSDGPSAADYDPNMDLQEVRLREQRLEKGTADYEEIRNDHQAITSSTTSAEKTSNPPAPKEFDMFADDDDDDMFAPEPETHKKDDGTQAVRIPEAKQLDRSLLDDWDDPEGYYRIILGELLDGRYHVQTNLGKGVFSAVVRALDTKTDRLVAIKVIRKQESMYKAGLKEIETLETLAEADPDDKRHMIRLERHFEHKGHLCMVFENLR